MRLTLQLLIVSAFAIFSLTGCGRGAAIYNVPKSDVELRKGTNEDQVYKAIKAAGANLGWIITKTKPGLAQGQLNLRGNMAVVDIPYTTNSYAIEYRDSTGLRYDPARQTIHKNYNGWIQNLDRAIRVQLNMLQD